MITRTKAIAATLTLAALATGGCANMNQQWHANCRVTHKEILYSGTNGDTHRTKRLSTTCGDFNVSDSLAGGFNSYDTWNQLEEGKTYDIQTGGYRIGFFSQFPTVIKVNGPK